MERGASISLTIVLFLLLAPLAWAEPQVMLSPLEMYESNEADFQLNISNAGSANYEITALHLDMTPLAIKAAVDYKGWTELYNDSKVDWTEGSIANNVFLSAFEFLAEAPLVTEDSQNQLSLTVNDAQGTPHTYTFDINVLNDNTPPALEEVTPQDGGLVKKGTANQPVSAKVTDPETGIASVAFHWIRCHFTENITVSDRTMQLAENEGYYVNSIDLSDYDNEQKVCFDFTATNKGGETTIYEGELTVDGVPPTVTLASPVDNQIIGLEKNFSFFSEDNLSPKMDCRMYVDGVENLTGIEAPAMDMIFIPSSEAAEGQHTWYMVCADMAGWEGQSETRTYTLDKTPPQITMKSPANNAIISDSTPLDFEVTDNYELHKVKMIKDGAETEMTAAFTLDVKNWSDGANTFKIVAEDSVGNIAESEFTVTIDRTAPIVNLAAPADMASNDVHVSFIYVVNDNYDPEMTCNLYIDGTGGESQAAAGEAETTQAKLVPVGEHNWKVQCVDDAGNLGTSEERSLIVIDTTGPDVVFENPEEFFRGTALPVKFTVTDISGVKTVSATMRTPEGLTSDLNLQNMGDQYLADYDTTTATMPGTYVIDVLASDTLDNANTATDQVEILYSYAIDLTLAPQSTTPSAQITVSGLVIYDNGSAIPETQVQLTLPANVTQTAELVGGVYSATFTAPATDGAYDVTTSITSAENEKTYTETKQLTVATPAPASSGHSGGGSGGGHGGTNYNQQKSTDDEGCTTDWDCIAWSPCKGGEQTRTCVDLNGCSTEDNEESRECTEKKKEAKNDDDTGTTEQTESSDFTGGSDPTEEQQTVPTEENTGDTGGIGKATGFLTLADGGWTKMILVLLAVAALLGLLYRYGWSRRTAPQDVLRGRSNIDLKDYMDMMSKRKH